jgi:hypothetical protein
LARFAVDRGRDFGLLHLPFSLPIVLRYDIGITLLSLAAAVVTGSGTETQLA